MTKTTTTQLHNDNTENQTMNIDNNHYASIDDNINNQNNNDNDDDNNNNQPTETATATASNLSSRAVGALALWRMISFDRASCTSCRRQRFSFCW